RGVGLHMPDAVVGREAGHLGEAVALPYPGDVVVLEADAREARARRRLHPVAEVARAGIVIEEAGDGAAEGPVAGDEIGFAGHVTALPTPPRLRIPSFLRHRARAAGSGRRTRRSPARWSRGSRRSEARGRCSPCPPPSAGASAGFP